MSRSGVCVCARVLSLVGVWSTALLAKPPRREHLACAFWHLLLRCADSIPWAPFKYLRVIDLCLFLSLSYCHFIDIATATRENMRECFLLTRHTPSYLNQNK